MRINRVRGGHPRRPLVIDDESDLAGVLLRARGGAGMTQNAAWKFSGVHENEISHYERGVHRPHVRQLIRLLRAYKMRLHAVPMEMKMVFVPAASDLSGQIRQLVEERDLALARLAQERREVAGRDRRIAMLEGSVRRLSARRRDET